MKTLLTVTYAKRTEPYSGRFEVKSKELDIITRSYSLTEAVKLFIVEFTDQFKYWNYILDAHLNKEALKEKVKFLSHTEAYQNLKFEGGKGCQK